MECGGTDFTGTGESADTGAGGDSDADEGFVDSGVSAVAVGDVHRVVEGAGIDESGGEAKDDLGGDENERVIHTQHESERGDECDLGTDEPAGLVMPAGPFPGEEKSAEASESPDGSHDAHEGEAFDTGGFGEWGFDGDEDVDGDIGEGVADPGHEEEAFGAEAELGRVDVVLAGGFVGDILLADSVGGGGPEKEDHEGYCAAERGEEEDISPPPFFESAAGEECDETGGAPGEIVERGAGAEANAGACTGEGAFDGGPDCGAGGVEGKHDEKDHPGCGDREGGESGERGENAAEDHHSDDAARAEAFGEAAGVEADEDVGEPPEGAQPEGGAGGGVEDFDGVVVAAGGREGGGVGVEEFDGVPGAEGADVGGEGG